VSSIKYHIRRTSGSDYAGHMALCGACHSDRGAVLHGRPLYKAKGNVTFKSWLTAQLAKKLLERKIGDSKGK
jgi:hypothetical protein